MSSRIIWIVIILWIIFLGVITVCSMGCSMFSGQRSQSTITTSPTPGVQLWQAAKKSNWLVTISILGIAGGVFAMANGASKLGIATIASSSASLFMALAVARFSMWLAVCGLVGSIAAVLFSILARRKALVEIIKGVQNFKINREPLLIEEINGILGAEQANTTKKIVGNIKNELKLKGAI